jgi:hypothetical protein
MRRLALQAARVVVNPYGKATPTNSRCRLSAVGNVKGDGANAKEMLWIGW